MTPLSDLSLTVDQRGQLTAIAWLRWRLFSNALRTRRGKLELLSRAIVALAFAGGGLGGAALMGGAAFFFVSEGKPEMLALLLWTLYRQGSGSLALESRQSAPSERTLAS